MPRLEDFPRQTDKIRLDYLIENPKVAEFMFVLAQTEDNLEKRQDRVRWVIDKNIHDGVSENGDTQEG